MAAAVTNTPFIQAVPGHPDLYEVSTGGGTYTVNAVSGDCGCPHFVHRLAHQEGRLCRHAEALSKHLREQDACPYCQGGFVLLQVRYLGPDATPESPLLPCSICDGTGRRSSDPLPSQEDLKRLFA